MIDRRSFLKSVAGITSAPFFFVPKSVYGETTKKANVIFIIVDDSEYIEYGCYGGKTLTPNIDSIAQQGVLFKNGFTTSSVCTPTRYTCMSGKYASRAESLYTEDHQPKNMSTFVRWNTNLESGGWNIASVLRNNGYATGMVGKWHIGHGEYYQQKYSGITIPESIHGRKAVNLNDTKVNEYLKNRYAIQVEDIKKSYGFDYVAAFYGGNLTDFPVSLKNFAKHNQDWITQGAVDFISRNAEIKKPFFLYLSTTLQHGPSPSDSVEADRKITAAGLIEKAPDVQPGYESIYKRLDDAGIPRDRAPYLWLDDGVGAVLDRLKQHHIDKDTAVFFFSDQQSWGKGSCLDGGVRTPYLFTWPNGVKGGQVNEELVSNIDFAPTIFDICDVTVPTDMHLDGMSFLPLVKGRDIKWRDAAFFELGNMRAVHTKYFKYIAIRRFSDEEWGKMPPSIQKNQEFRNSYFRLNKEWTASSPEHLRQSSIAKWRYDHAKYAEDADQLYDLRIDAGETVNLAGNAEYADVLREMKALLKKWLATMPGPYWEFKG